MTLLQGCIQKILFLQILVQLESCMFIVAWSILSGFHCKVTLCISLKVSVVPTVFLLTVSWRNRIRNFCNDSRVWFSTPERVKCQLIIDRKRYSLHFLLKSVYCAFMSRTKKLTMNFVYLVYYAKMNFKTNWNSSQLFFSKITIIKLYIIGALTCISHSNAFMTLLFYQLKRCRKR